MNMVIGELPEYIVALTAFLTLAVCCISWFRYNEYAALGYILPLFYFCVLYVLIAFFNPNDEIRREWVRLGLVILFSDIFIWRIVYIKRQKGKQK